MIRLVLFLLVIAACEAKPSEEELVGACQAVAAFPIYDLSSSVRCFKLSGKQQTPPAARYN